MLKRTIGIFEHNPCTVLSQEEADRRDELNSKFINLLVNGLGAVNVRDGKPSGYSLYVWLELPLHTGPVEELSCSPDGIPKEYRKEELTFGITVGKPACTFNLIKYIADIYKGSYVSVMDLSSNEYWKICPFGIMNGDVSSIIDLYNQQAIESDNDDE